MEKKEKITKLNPFRVPENYFEEVNRKILSDTAESKAVKRIFSLHRIRPLIAVAAAITGFIVIGYITIKLFTPDTEYTGVSEIMTEDNIELYFNDIDLSSLEENAAENAAITDIFEEGPEISSREIINYLLSENIGIAEIYEHL